MKRNSTVFLAILLWSAGFGASLGDSNEDAAPPPVAAAPESGVPIETLVRNVAKKTGKRFVIDPRVHGSVQLIGEEPANVTYGEFLTVLQVEGFTAVESSSGLVRVIPEYIVRQSALPLVSGAASFPDAQYVAAVIPVQRIPAATLVPILRPLLPQQAHLALLSAHPRHDFARIFGGRSAGERCLGHAEQLERLALDAGQFGEEHLNGAILAQQRVPLGEAEEAQDLLGGRVLAATLFGVDR
jgi:type II secretory pathway component GspD/PulD (secretin)